MTKEQIFKALDKIIIHIGENFNAEEREIYLDDQIDGHEDFPYEFSVASGISKAVILIKGADFVIKMPFFKLYDDDYYRDAHNDWESLKEYEYEEFLANLRKEHNNELYMPTHEEEIAFHDAFNKEHPEPDCDDEDYYFELQGANNISISDGDIPTIPNWDYCRLEEVIYQLAVEEGLGAYFAEEGYLGTIDQTPVYYQTRCIPMSEMDLDRNSKEYKQKSKSSKELCDKLDIGCFSPIWIYDFIETYGVDELKRLNSFLCRYEIGDLRECNIGYLDGAPILFDYSDYRDW